MLRKFYDGYAGELGVGRNSNSVEPDPCPQCAEKDKEIESVLLSFCHWVGKKGYKINGYDDGQLMTIINQFKTENKL